MTLHEWAAKQPLKVAKHDKYFPGKGPVSYWIPDDSRLVDRAEAWSLDDYRVTAVTGGTIWFMPRKV
jgi:hypothetical protein